MSRPRRSAPLAVAAAAILGYVDRAGTVIASRTARPDLPYEFQVVNTDVVNAFAVPGGFLHVSRGLPGERG